MNAATIITVLNLKGGVGKTHAVWLFMAVSQERRLRTLGLDLDTQGNLTSSLVAQAEPMPGVEMFFHPGAEGDPNALIRKTPFSGIDFVPASARLARYDLSNQDEWEAADLQLSLVEPLRQ